MPGRRAASRPSAVEIEASPRGLPRRGLGRFDAVSQGLRIIERKLGERHRVTEEKALSQLAAGGAQVSELLWSFNAFRCRLNVEISS